MKKPKMLTQKTAVSFQLSFFGLNVGSGDESSHCELRQLGGTDGDRALPLVGNEAQFPEAIHKKTDSGSGCADHFRQLFLMAVRNDLLRFASVAEFSKQEESSGQPFVAGV